MKRAIRYIGLLAVLVSVFAVFFNSHHDEDDHRLKLRAIEQKLDDLEKLASSVTEEILAIRIGLSSNYQKLSTLSTEIGHGVSAISALPTVKSDVDLFLLLEGYIDSLILQKNLVEFFKSKNAIRRNSESYFLHLAKEIEQKKQHFAVDHADVQIAMNKFIFQVLERLVEDSNATVKFAYENRMPDGASAGQKELFVKISQMVRHGKTAILLNGEVTEVIEALNRERHIKASNELRRYITKKIFEHGQRLSTRNTAMIIVSLCLAFVAVWMLIALLRALGKLTHANTNLEKRVAERTEELQENKRELEDHRDHLEEVVEKRTEALRIQSEELELALVNERQYNVLQTDFVSMVSHEFRTPLAIIDMTAQRIIRRKQTTSLEDLRKFADGMRSNVQRLTNLIDRTLSMSKFDAGRLDFHAEEVDLAALLRTLCDQQGKLSADIELHLEIDRLPESIHGDKGLLQQIFTNLLSNAIKYSPPGGDVVVRAGQDGERVRVEVIDHGIGIPENELPKLFERFFRASNARGISGTGIGLSITKTMIERHDGVLDVVSAEGRGSAFMVTLPVYEGGAETATEAMRRSA